MPLNLVSGHLSKLKKKKINRSTPKFLKHSGNFSPGSITQVVKAPTPSSSTKRENRQTVYLHNCLWFLILLSPAFSNTAMSAVTKWQVRANTSGFGNPTAPIKSMFIHPNGGGFLLDAENQTQHGTNFFCNNTWRFFWEAAVTELWSFFREKSLFFFW